MASFFAESPNNYEQKCICCFVIDVSGSMSGAPIKELNKGLKTFHEEISSDSIMANRLEIAVIEFSDKVTTLINPSLVEKFEMPELTTKGTTKLVDGVRDAIKLVENRKNWYKETGQPYLRPWIILITDGAPDKDQDVNSLEEEIERSTKGKKFIFLPIGVQGADMKILNQISGYTQSENSWNKMPAMLLEGLKFSSFFAWVSASMSIVASSKEGEKINLPDPNSWTKGFSI